MSDNFILDKQLAADTHHLASWPLCEVRLMDDAQYPWLILVPRLADVREIYQLDESQRKQLDAESVYLGKAMMTLFGGDKLNVAALGNVVSQLHIHHVVRFQGDAAWPAPVWGKLPVQAYDSEALKARMHALAGIADKHWS